MAGMKAGTDVTEKIRVRLEKGKQGHANRTERCHRGRTDQTPKSMPYMERGQLSLNSILMCQLRPGCQLPPSWKEKKFLVDYYVTFSQSYLSTPLRIACPLLPLLIPYKCPTSLTVCDFSGLWQEGRRTSPRGI